MQDKNIVTKDGRAEFILSRFNDTESDRTYRTMRFDVWDKRLGRTTMIDLPYEDAITLRDALTEYIDEFTTRAGRNRLNHVASIVTDEALTPSERLAMLAEEFRNDKE
jgi:hypothetical protein